MTTNIANPDPGLAGPGSSLRRTRGRPGERVIEALLLIAAGVSVLTTIGIVASLFVPTIEFFERVSFREFFFGTSWTPLFDTKNYGVLPLVVATLVVTVIATAIAVPLGLGAATYLSEYAGDRLRRVLKPLLEILAGVPTVVYGFFALSFLNPILISIWPGDEKPDYQNVLVGGIAMGIMIMPTVASLSEDAMSAVPRSLREGAVALASTQRQVSVKVVFPAAISGIIAAVVLGVSRAIGETMIVMVAVGLSSNGINFDPTEPNMTMTAYIAAAGAGDLPVSSFEYNTIFAVGALLFVSTFIVNAISIRMVRRFREVYE